MTDDSRRTRRLRKAELALRALGEKGNAKSAAEHLGISADTLRRLVAFYCDELGYQSPVHAAYMIDRLDRGAQQGRMA